MIAENAVQLHREHHMRLPDAIIWRTAKTHNAVLITHNTKDFNPEWEGIRLPYKL
jgi:predicted nucleic acid-binding protein